MIPEIQKILYTTDLSANSAYAFRYAMNFAIQHDADIIFLHVVEPLPSSMQAIVGPYMPAGMEREIIEEKKTHRMDQIRKRLKSFSDKELKDDPEGLERVKSIEICEGFPEAEILRKADELDCDIIIMGTHGKGILKHTFFGNTAKKVIRRVRKPVFIVPLPEGEIDITFHDDV